MFTHSCLFITHSHPALETDTSFHRCWSSVRSSSLRSGYNVHRRSFKHWLTLALHSFTSLTSSKSLKGLKDIWQISEFICFAANVRRVEKLSGQTVCVCVCVCASPRWFIIEDKGEGVCVWSI